MRGEYECEHRLIELLSFFVFRFEQSTEHGQKEAVDRAAQIQIRIQIEDLLLGVVDEQLYEIVASVRFDRQLIGQLLDRILFELFLKFQSFKLMIHIEFHIGEDVLLSHIVEQDLPRIVQPFTGIMMNDTENLISFVCVL